MSKCSTGAILLSVWGISACEDAEDRPGLAAAPDVDACVVARVQNFEITGRHAREIGRALRPPPTYRQAVRLAVDAAAATCDVDCSLLSEPADEWLPAYRRLVSAHSLEHHGLEGIGGVVAGLWKKHGIVKGECYAEIEEG